jgi:hypothetical protein
VKIFYPAKNPALTLRVSNCKTPGHQAAAHEKAACFRPFFLRSPRHGRGAQKKFIALSALFSFWVMAVRARLRGSLGYGIAHRLAPKRDTSPFPAGGNQHIEESAAPPRFLVFCRLKVQFLCWVVFLCLFFGKMSGVLTERIAEGLTQPVAPSSRRVLGVISLCHVVFSVNFLVLVF